MNANAAVPSTHQPNHSPREALLTELGLMTQDQVATALDVTKHTLMTWRTSGEGPDFVKSGKLILYRKQDILDWIERQVVPTTRTAR